ncbi:uncharacterized protein [Apostichopus japonicus]|uniref:uncharacterized protein isoform X2 n=1 Tax=Stichopus japonicus TaxID=307972 RepID=UPI003AB50C8C
MEGIKQYFNDLASSQPRDLDIKSEISTLQAIKKCLTSEAPLAKKPSLDLEQDFLTVAADSLGADYTDPFPSFKLDAVLQSQEELNDFTLYVLERRYGWSEVQSSREQSDDKEQKQRDKAIDHEQVGRLKSYLNELLDVFIHWFLCQSISVPILCSFRNAISKASNRPVVRNQAVVIIMDWLHQNCHQPCFHKHWRQVQELLVCGITDIWSAIRNACIGRLKPIVDRFTLVKLEAFYCTLVKICQNRHSSWQAKEGAIMAVIVILRNFHWVGRLSHSFSEHSINETSFYLKYGHEEMNQLPRFLADSLHSLIYPLLAHPQISVRENATKAFSSFLSRCDFQEALNALDEAISRLSPLKEPISVVSLADDSATRVVDLPADEEQFIDAYEAEGLISVCIGLIKQIPASFLLQKWTFYFSVYNICLMHPASTVRQATSTLLKYLVAKSSQAPVVLKLTLQSLVTNWCVSVEQILSMHQGIKRPNIKITLGKATRDNSACPDDASAEESSDQTLLATWEWREGRLLTYELIAKYLVHNHVHYFFPPHAIHRARFRGSQSVDAAMQSRYLKSSSGEKIGLSKSFGYATHRQAWATSRGQSEEESSASTTPNESPRHEISPTPNNSELTRMGSDRRKKNLEQKRSKTLAEGNLHSQLTTPNQYYYADDSRKSPTYSPKKKVSPLMAPYSLLHLIKNMETDDKENGLDVTKARYIPFPRRSGENVNSEQSDDVFKDVLVDGKEEAEKWELVSMPTLLMQMLLQTVECLGSDQWELRRMGHQTLPILTEAIRYYDVTLLNVLIERHFSPNPTVMTYGLTLAIKSTLQHALRLENYAESSPETSNGSGKSVSLQEVVATGVSSWALTAKQLALRPVIDKLSLAAVDILFLACTNFSHYLDGEMKGEVEATCVKLIMDVFSHAHPSHRYSRHLFKTRRARVDFDTPGQGYLSILKGDGLVRLSLHIQHSLISECHTLLPSFISEGPVREVASILPILLHLVIVFMEDHDILRTILESCRCLVTMVDEADSCLFPDEFFTALEYSLLAIIDIINMKVTEVSTLRPVTEFYVYISQLVSSTYHLTALFKVIHSRLQDAGFPKSTLDTCNSDLVYRSNDIPASPVDNQPIAEDADDDYEENVGPGHHPLTTSLNASSGSGQGILAGASTRRMSQSMGLPTDDSDSDSDWDSWDEEEEDQSLLEEMFGDFLRRLQGHYRQTAIPGEQSAFEVRLETVGTLTKRTIFKLLHTDL